MQPRLEVCAHRVHPGDVLGHHLGREGQEAPGASGQPVRGLALGAGKLCSCSQLHFSLGYSLSFSVDFRIGCVCPQFHCCGLFSRKCRPEMLLPLRGLWRAQGVHWQSCKLGCSWDLLDPGSCSLPREQRLGWLQSRHWARAKGHEPRAPNRDRKSCQQRDPHPP